MYNTTLRFTIGSVMLVAGGILVYTSISAIDRSIARLARKQARLLKHRAADVVDAARGAAAEKVLEAVDAGKAAFQKVGNRVAERVAG
jgi:hypothetical protein